VRRNFVEEEEHGIINWQKAVEQGSHSSKSDIGLVETWKLPKRGTGEGIGGGSNIVLIKEKKWNKQELQQRTRCLLQQATRRTA
jgi:hypothetical protein